MTSKAWDLCTVKNQRESTKADGLKKRYDLDVLKKLLFFLVSIVYVMYFPCGTFSAHRSLRTCNAIINLLAVFQFE